MKYLAKELKTNYFDSEEYFSQEDARELKIFILGNSDFVCYPDDFDEDIVHFKDESCDEDIDKFASYLTEKYGEKFVVQEIHGCVQGDWQYLVCKESISYSMISYVEAVYFNTGKEYVLYVEDSEDINGEPYVIGYFYSAEWVPERIKESIAEQYGIDAKDLKLQKISGEKTVTEYIYTTY